MDKKASLSGATDRRQGERFAEFTEFCTRCHQRGRRQTHLAEVVIIVSSLQGVGQGRRVNREQGIKIKVCKRIANSGQGLRKLNSIGAQILHSDPVCYCAAWHGAVISAALSRSPVSSDCAFTRKPGLRVQSLHLPKNGLGSAFSHGQIIPHIAGNVKETA